MARATAADFAHARILRARSAGAALCDVRPGDRLIPDRGWLCMTPGEPLTVKVAPNRRRFLPCRAGRHYLSGQTDASGALVGLTRETVE